MQKIRFWPIFADFCRFLPIFADFDPIPVYQAQEKGNVRMGNIFDSVPELGTLGIGPVCKYIAVFTQPISPSPSPLETEGH